MKYMILISLLLNFSHSIAIAADPYSDRLTAQTYTLNKLTEELTEINNTLNDCNEKVTQKWNPTVELYKCHQYGVSIVGTKIEELKKRKAELDKQKENLLADIKSKKNSQNLSEGEKLQLGTISADANLLFMKLDNLDTKLQLAGTNRKVLMTQIDNTVLGAYTKYVIENSYKDPQFCQNVNSCMKSSNDQTKKDISTIKGKIQTLEQFKREMLNNHASGTQPTGATVDSSK